MNQKQQETECYLMDEAGEWRFAVIPTAEFEQLAEDMQAMSESQYFAWLAVQPNVEVVDRETAEWRGFEDSAMDFETVVAGDNEIEDDEE